MQGPDYLHFFTSRSFVVTVTFGVRVVPLRLGLTNSRLSRQGGLEAGCHLGAQPVWRGCGSEPTGGPSSLT